MVPYIAYKLLRRVRRTIARICLPSFASRPNRLIIDPPWRIYNPDKISIGDDVYIGPNCYINAITKFRAGDYWQQFSPQISIGNRVGATAALQIHATQEIIIEDDVMFASNVYLGDSSHGYGMAGIPYRDQRLVSAGSIRIGRGSWIGQNVVVLPGVTIGELSIIGANSVVTKSVGSKCIVVGAPAQIIKIWSEERAAWEIPPVIKRSP